jgi:LacI family transcriptional regulator
MDENQLPSRFSPVVERFPCVVTGVRTRDPALSFACVDHHVLALQAVEQALALGYQRPALVLDPVIDDLVEGRFTAGFLIGLRRLPRAQRLPPFHDVDAARRRPALFHRWLRRTHPDVIFTLYNVVRRWVEEGGWSVPGDVGLIQLEWRAARPDWAGMNQHNDVVGETAIDMLVSMIHGSETGCPAFPRATQISPSWVPGSTVRAAGQGGAAGSKP